MADIKYEIVKKIGWCLSERAKVTNLVEGCKSHVRHKEK